MTYGCANCGAEWPCRCGNPARIEGETTGDTERFRDVTWVETDTESEIEGDDERTAE